MLLSEQEPKEEDWNELVETKAPVRPPALEAGVIRLRNDYEKRLAFVGCLNGKPYEIFTGRLEDAFAIPSYVTQGSIVRIKDSEGKIELRLSVYRPRPLQATQRRLVALL